MKRLEPEVERQVRRLVAKGYRLREIGRMLRCSRHAVTRSLATGNPDPVQRTATCGSHVTCPRTLSGRRSPRSQKIVVRLPTKPSRSSTKPPGNTPITDPTAHAITELLPIWRVAGDGRGVVRCGGSAPPPPPRPVRLCDIGDAISLAGVVTACPPLTGTQPRER